ncbi:MAG: glycosyltransferase family 4 protein, partial [Planctomycetia bacterium]|nr:glycosyltransferase family 4 protein [Planctomycetia bacterium]
VRCPLTRFVKAMLNRADLKKMIIRGIESRQFAPPVPQVVALSRMVRNDILHFYGVPEDHVHIVYNGVDTEHFSPARVAEQRSEARRALGIPDDVTVFCLVAHNFKLKGLRELVEAAAEVRKQRSEFRLLIVGRGRTKPYQRLARRLRCEGQMIFAGPIDDIRPMYAASDVYVHPTWYDPCSLVVLEALACGLPVITTRFNGVSELITDGLDGFVIDTPRDVSALAERMMQLFDAELRGRMGAEARRLADQHTLERNFTEMMFVFEKAVRLKQEEEK